uniref:V-set domain-containing T-cell activation inhibitor 1-like n=1 Tax=Scatophagus argus TaxID=75038 RepID=UPI001ED7DCBC|nr:V-set domain-containing T-cell activation inhibitor 1-like [Scatophagus argus]
MCRLMSVVLLLVCTVNTVTCQVKVEAHIGDTVLLPCSYSEVTHLSDETTVFWVDKDDSILLEITGFKTTFASQNKKFRDRVRSFSEQHRKGNFSILMDNVQQSDSGPYDCFNVSLDFKQRVLLSVSGTRVDATAATDPPGPSGGAVGTPNPLHTTSLSLLFTSLPMLALKL